MHDTRVCCCLLRRQINTCMAIVNAIPILKDIIVAICELYNLYKNIMECCLHRGEVDFQLLFWVVVMACTTCYPQVGSGQAGCVDVRVLFGGGARTLSIVYPNRSHTKYIKKNLISLAYGQGPASARTRLIERVWWVS